MNFVGPTQGCERFEVLASRQLPEHVRYLRPLKPERRTPLLLRRFHQIVEERAHCLLVQLHRPAATRSLSENDNPRVTVAQPSRVALLPLTAVVLTIRSLHRLPQLRVRLPKLIWTMRSSLRMAARQTRLD